MRCTVHRHYLMGIFQYLYVVTLYGYFLLKNRSEFSAATLIFGVCTSCSHLIKNTLNSNDSTTSVEFLAEIFGIIVNNTEMISDCKLSKYEQSTSID